MINVIAKNPLIPWSKQESFMRNQLSAFNHVIKYNKQEKVC